LQLLSVGLSPGGAAQHLETHLMCSAVVSTRCAKAKGSVNGQKIELLSLGDKFEPKLPAENARILIEDKGVVAMFLTCGTPDTDKARAKKCKDSHARSPTGNIAIKKPPP